MTSAEKIGMWMRAQDRSGKRRRKEDEKPNEEEEEREEPMSEDDEDELFVKTPKAFIR